LKPGPKAQIARLAQIVWRGRRRIPARRSAPRPGAIRSACTPGAGTTP